VSLSSRTVENAVVVSDSETVVIGGLISDDYEDTETKVPWLGDIPVLGWAFKSTNRSLQKTNLLIFLTPHIVRTALDLEYETIRKREEFWDRSQEGVKLSERERKEQEERRREAEAAGIAFRPVKGRRPVRARLVEHTERYPIERMREIETQRAADRAAAREAADAAGTGPSYGILAATFRDEGAAAATLQEVLDAGYDGTLVSGDHGGEVLYEVRVGPFPSLESAEQGAAVLRESFGLAPTVTVDAEER
jgi:general secretion pathway protein D